MPSLLEMIGEDLTVPAQLIEKALRLAHIRFRKIHVPKRSGGYRTIVQPAAELKMIHSWLSSKVLSRLPLSEAAAAFRPGASIIRNADVHRASKYSVRVDLVDFFPSIRSADLMRVVLAARAVLPPWVVEPDFFPFIRKACFDRDDQLPIGYPTSPAVANAVMINIDDELLRLIASSTDVYGRARLTRYADDFVFSTDKAGACQTFVHAMRGLITATTSPRVGINDFKTRFMSRPGGSTLVTGLRINKDGIVRVHANYRDHVRLMLKHFASGTLKLDEHQKLVGHLAYVEHSDPRLFTRLSFRYFDEIARLRGT